MKSRIVQLWHIGLISIYSEDRYWSVSIYAFGVSINLSIVSADDQSED